MTRNETQPSDTFEVLMPVAPRGRSFSNKLRYCTCGFTSNIEANFMPQSTCVFRNARTGEVRDSKGNVIEGVR